MEKSFKYYYKEGFKASLKALKGLGIFKYLLITIINVIASFLIIPIPLVAIINVRLAKNIRLDKRISFTKSLRSADEPIGIWNLILSMLISLVLFLGVVAIIGIFTLILYSIGAGIVSLIDVDMLYATYFLIPGGIALVGFIISLPFIYIPVCYVIEENPKISMSKAIYNALYSLKQGGKLNIFLNGLIYWPIASIMIFMCFIPIIISDSLDPAYYGIIPIISSVLVLIVMFVLPLFSLSYLVVKQNIYEDVLADTYSGVKEISGVNPKVVKKARKTNDISALFDNVEEIDEIPDLASFEGEILAKSEDEKEFSNDDNVAGNKDEQAKATSDLEPSASEEEMDPSVLDIQGADVQSSGDETKYDDMQFDEQLSEESMDNDLIEEDIVTDELKKAYQELLDDSSAEQEESNPLDKEVNSDLNDLNNQAIDVESLSDIEEKSQSVEEAISLDLNQDEAESVDDILKQLAQINDYEDVEDEHEESFDDEINKGSRGE